MTDHEGPRHPSSLGILPFRTARSGVPVLPLRPSTEPVDLDLVRLLLDEEDLGLLRAERNAGLERPGGEDGRFPPRLSCGVPLASPTYRLQALADWWGNDRTASAASRWKTLSLVEELAKLGSELERTIAGRSKGREQIAMRAFERAPELLDLTTSGDRHRGRRRELARVREGLIDHVFCDNGYQSRDQDWQRYFLRFAVAARAGR